MSGYQFVILLHLSWIISSHYFLSSWIFLMSHATLQFVRVELTTPIAYFKIWGKFNIHFELLLVKESFIQSNFEILSIFI